MHLRLTVLASLAVTLVACADDPIRSVTPEVLEIPPLFAVGDNGTGTFATFEPIPASAVCTALPATLAGFATYNPFVIAQGYTQRILADEIGDFAPVAGGSGGP